MLQFSIYKPDFNSPYGDANKVLSPLWSLTLCTLAALLLALADASIAASPDAHEPLVLAVHPYRSHHDIIQSFRPLANYIARKTGYKVQVRIGTSYQQHLEAIGENRVDIAFMGPASYVRLVDNYGPKPLLARLAVNGVPYMRGHVVTRDNSTVRDLAELSGKRIAFGTPLSTMSYQVPHFELRKAGVSEQTLEGARFYGSHDDVAMAVLAGDADAGALNAEAYEKFRPQGLRSISTSPAISEHLFLVRSDLPQELILELRRILLGLKPGNPAARPILSALRHGTTALLGVRDSDYEQLRRILRQSRQTDPTP